MTDRALEWMSYRRSGKMGDLPGELIGMAGERRFVDNAVTLGHAEWTAPNGLADCAASTCRPAKGWRDCGGPLRRPDAEASRRPRGGVQRCRNAP